MSSWRIFAWLTYLFIGAAIPVTASARCDSPKLREPVLAFEARHVSRIEAVLKLGREHNVCFGIEFVDRAQLTEPADFDLQHTTLGTAIRTLLGDQHSQVVEVRDGVIWIGQRTHTARPRGVFDHVVPICEIRRASVQEISMGLEMRLESDLNPKITGFAGDYRSGDLYNLVGPFKEHNRTIRQLLDQIVAESKGGAWILPAEDTRAWEILEYRDPNMNYTVFLRVIAAH